MPAGNRGACQSFQPRLREPGAVCSPGALCVRRNAESGLNHCGEVRVWRTVKILLKSTLALAALSLSACIDPALLGPPGPGYGGGYSDPGGYGGGGYGSGPGYGSGHSGHGHGGAEEDFGPRSYSKGFECGKSDGRSGRSESYSRHRGEYNPRYESSFRDGYSRGYDEGRRERPSHSHGDRDDYFGGPDEWYKSGYALGKRDRREGKSCNYSRHDRHYDGRTRAQFARGYNDGYDR